MIQITTYDDVGRLLVAKTIEAISSTNTGPFNRYVNGIWDTLAYYVVAGNAVPRPQNPTNLTGTTLFNVPLPATIRIDRLGVFDATDSTVELDLPPGKYLVEVIAFPYTVATFTVVV